MSITNGKKQSKERGKPKTIGWMYEGVCITTGLQITIGGMYEGYSYR